MKYHVFISHANEDKQDIAFPLAVELKKHGLSVWFDEFELKLGDSISSKINLGLSESQFGVLILSPHFFKKNWTIKELEGFFTKAESNKFILPIWHNITTDYIKRHLPILADKKAVSTDKGITYIANQILKVVKPEINDSFDFEFDHNKDNFHETILPQLKSLTKQLIKIIDEIHQDEVLKFQSKKFFKLINEQKIELQQALDDISNISTYKTAIVGDFKVGKSLFVNALFNTKELASVDTNPETGVITTFSYSEKAYAIIHMMPKQKWEMIKKAFKTKSNVKIAFRYKALYEMESDGTLRKYYLNLFDLEKKLILEPTRKIVIACKNWENIKDFKAFTENIEKWTVCRSPLYYFVDQIEAFAPIPMLKDGIQIIDTPGLNDTDQYRSDLTKEFLRNVDCILFLTQSGRSYSETDKRFIIEQIRTNRIKKIRLIVTKCDQTFMEAIKNAHDKEEKLPTYDMHIKREKERLKKELEHTIDEILDDETFSIEKKKDYYDLLKSMNIDFISSRDHFDGELERAGIVTLRKSIRQMLSRSERVLSAESILRKLLISVNSHIFRNLEIILQTVEYEHELDIANVRGQFKQLSSDITSKLDLFKTKTQNEIIRLREKRANESKHINFVVKVIIEKAEKTVNAYEENDISKHFMTLRYGYWAYLDEVKSTIANAVFPYEEHILNLFINNLEESIREIKKHLITLGNDLNTLYEKYRIQNFDAAFNFISHFNYKTETLIQDLKDNIEANKESIILHLDNFSSKRIELKLQKARKKVYNIEGKGTSDKQKEEIRKSYRYLRNKILDELETYINKHIDDLIEKMEANIRALYEKINEDISQRLKERLQIIESNLITRNKKTKNDMIYCITNYLKDVEEIQEKIKSIL